MTKKTDKTEEPVRPLSLEWRTPQELTENECNWREHPAEQVDATSEFLEEVGWAGALLFNSRTNRLLDGHMRRNLALMRGDEKVPVLIGDWSEEQERKILATLDPLTMLATANAEKLAALAGSIDSEAIRVNLEKMAKDAGAPGEDKKVEPLELKPPPKMVWLLCAIPLDKWGEAQPSVVKLQEISGVTVQSNRD